MKRAGTALALAALCVAAATGTAQGAGTTTISLKGKAVKSLRSQHVRIGAFGGARAGRARLVLPVAGGLVTSSALLNQRGGLRLSRRAAGRRRSMVLRRLQLRLGRKSEIVGRIGSSRFTLFSVKAPAARLRLDSGNGSASLRGGSVSLTRRAGAAIKRRLRLRRLPRGAFGRLSVDALVKGDGTGGSGGGGPGGEPGGGPPASGPLGDEPPVLARPASAVNVTGAQITWHVRPSWIRYVPVNAPFAGAWGDPPTSAPQCGESNEPAVEDVYSFHFPFAHGWYDPPTKTAAAYFTGGVNFKYPTHGIDLDTKDPEIEINGASSRAIFRFDGRGDTNPGNKRSLLVDLATSASPPVEGPGTLSYDRIPGAIPSSGGSQSVFAGFYLPGERFGCVSLSLTYGGG